jgi:integrase
MRARHRGSKVFFYFDAGGKPRKEIPLGSDYALAVQKWSKLQCDKAPVALTVGWLIGKYTISVEYQRLASGTQADYRYALDQISAHFADAPLDQVRPSHIVMYRDKRSAESRHRALREIAVMGMLYRYAIAHDWATSNPVASIKRERLPGRKAIYIEDDVFAAVYAVACQPLKDAIDLAYLVGQRPGDVLALQETSIRDGILSLRQTKTGAPIRLRVDGALEAVLTRIAARKQAYPVRALALLVDERGRPLTRSKLRSRFEKAREQVPEAANFQFRDLRAKAATDLREAESLEAAQALLGHTSVTMTEHYTRSRKGKIGNAINSLPEFRKVIHKP